MCGCALMCVGMLGCALVCAGVHECALVYAGVRGCVQKFLGVCECVWGMNFQNIYWKIESLHQRTLIHILYEFLKKTLVEKEEGARSPKNVDIVSLSRRDSGCTGIMDHWPE